MAGIAAFDDSYRADREEFKRIFNEKFGGDFFAKVAIEAFRSHPEVHWLKFRNGVMCAINEEYSRRYRIPIIDYAEVNDSERWPKDIADEFSDNDRQVLRENRALFFTEQVEVDGKRETIRVQKWPVEVLHQGQVVRLVAGRVIDG